MGQGQSKDELLYQQVSHGNVEGIKELRRDGAGLEWIDRKGKTPLIAACMNPEHLNVAKTLIELGANLNFRRPGRHAGTPLHHAARRGLEHTVKLLLSCGANALLTDDNGQTPLDVARAKGNGNVVRAIESCICLFSGWLREFHGPSFLEALAPQLVSREVWVVVLPCGARNPTKDFKLELAIYPTMQDAQPRTVIALWKANLEEPKFYQPDPVVIVYYNSKIFRSRRRRKHRARMSIQTRIKLAPSNEDDKQQLQQFCNACKGTMQGSNPAFLQNTQTQAVPASASTVDDIELAINASIQTTMAVTPPFDEVQMISESSASTTWNSFIKKNSASGRNAPAVHEAGPSHDTTEHIQIQNNNYAAIQLTNETPIPALAPSAPPLTHEDVDEGPIYYPSIDCAPVDLDAPAPESLPGGDSDKKEGGPSSTCVICLDAPIEGACIPCGHMAGCMSCLKDIESKKWGCPVCRAKISQVIKLYAV